MRQSGSHLNSPDIMLAEVITPPPNLTIKVGDIQLDKDQLLVADYLLNEYQRAYYMEGVMHFEADTATGTLSGETHIKAHSHSVSGTGYAGAGVSGTAHSVDHDHRIKDLKITTKKDKFYAHGDGEDPVRNNGSAEKKYLTFKDTLKKDDLLVVQQLPGTEKFVIYCRVKTLE